MSKLVTVTHFQTLIYMSIDGFKERRKNSAPTDWSRYKT